MKLKNTAGWAVFLALMIISGGFFVASIANTGNNPTFEIKSINTHTESHNYKIGDLNINIGKPRYNCIPSADQELLAIYENNNPCWDISFNGIYGKAGQDYDYSDKGFILRHKETTAKTWCENGKCNILSPQDWNALYDVEINKNALRITSVEGNNHLFLNQASTFKIKSHSILPEGTTVGVSIDVDERMTQQSRSIGTYTKLSQNDLEFNFQLEFSGIGEVFVTAKTFAEVYDYSKPFVDTDTGLCIPDGKDTEKKYCVQKTRIPLGEPKQFSVYVSPESCSSTQECSGAFNCINNACILKETNQKNPEFTEQTNIFATIWNWIKGWFS